MVSFGEWVECLDSCRHRMVRKEKDKKEMEMFNGEICIVHEDFSNAIILFLGLFFIK